MAVAIQEIEYAIKKASSKIRKKKVNSGGGYNTSIVSNDLGEQIIRIDGDIPPDLAIENGDRFLFISKDQSAYSHGLHKYPAKFFPELPRWLIQRYAKKGSVILDPFCGSGTTNVEANLLGMKSYGVDIDEFAKSITGVKTQFFSVAKLKKTSTFLIDELKKYRPDKKIKLPEFPYVENWFEDFILHELSYIKLSIYQVAKDENIKRFLLLCFSSIVRAVSNADNNCTRTVVRKKLNKLITPRMALKMFVEKLIVNQQKIEQYFGSCPSKNLSEILDNSDAKCLDLKDNSIDLALTSPPYVNAVDYPRTHQLEGYLLDIFCPQTPLSNYKKSHVGTESVSINNYKQLNKINIPEADEVMAKIYKVDPRRAYISYKYLQDMELNLQEIYRVLKKNGRYIIVVGNNIIRSQLFESWKYLMSLAERNGFKIENYFGSEIIKHFIKVPRNERINTDWVIVLKK